MSLDAMKQALEALEEINKLSIGENAICLPAEIDEAMDALRERLAQPEQEPVAWMHPSWIDPDTRGWASDSFNAIPIEGWVPVFTAPRQWKGLTDEDVDEVERWIEFKEDGSGRIPNQKLVRYIERKLREKNT